MERKKKNNKLSQEKWTEIRTSFVQGIESPSGERVYPTIEMLAKQYNIHWNTLQRRQQKENWKDERAIFESKVAEDIDNKKRQEMLQQAVQFDFDSLKLARSLQGSIANILQMDNEKVRIVRQRMSLNIDRQKELNITDPIDCLKTNEINNLSMALEKAQRVGRLAFGESTENAIINSTTKSTTEELDEAFNLIREMVPRGKGSQNSIH